MLLNQNFLSIKPLQMMNFRLILSMMISLCSLITFDTKHLNKLIYTLVNLALNTYLNSYCESIFSTIRKICTDGLHNLGKDATQNHTATSLYTETTSIRKNLLGILIPKVNIFGKKKLACYE